MTPSLASDFKEQVYSVTGGVHWALVALIILSGDVETETLLVACKDTRG